MKKPNTSGGRFSLRASLGVTKMRLVILTVIFSMLWFDAWAQSQKVNFSAPKLKVSQLLSEIEKQTEYLFVYDKQKVDLQRTVNVQTQGNTVQNALKAAFDGTLTAFSLEGKNIVLSQTDKKSPATAPMISVSGVIIDEKGEPVIMANILLKGVRQGTTSDLDGKYTLNNVPANAKLVISSVGYLTKEISVDNKKVINVTLSEDAAVLDDMVVVGYAVQKKENLTGAVSVINISKQLDSRPITDVARGLQGSTPGLSVTTSTGAIGTDPTIKIRGVIGSVNGSSKPLILVDNAEVSSLSIINPDDIESVSVLKDAASASIYGARAAFGVVLITTKKAKDGQKFAVNYSNNFAWGTASVTPQIAKSYDSAQAALDVQKRVNGQTFVENDIKMKWDANSIERMKEWERVYGGMNLSPEMVLGRDFELINGQPYFYRSWDAPKMFIREWTPQQTHNLSINGTAAKTSYNMSLGYLQQMGIIKVNPDEFNRYNVSFNTSSPVNTWLSVRTKLLFSKTTLKTPHQFSSSSYDPWFYMYRWQATAPYGTYQGIPFRNAITETAQASMDEKTNNYTRIALGATATVTDDISVDFDYTYSRTDRVTKLNGGQVEGWDFWSGSMQNRVWTSSSYNNVNHLVDQSDFHVANIIGRFKKSIKEHNFSAIAGANIEYYNNFGVGAARLDLVDPSLPELGLATGEQSVSGYHGQWSTLGFFARINYNFKNKYLLELNGRLDGSSRFPTNMLWGFFPSASAGYILTEEKYMESLKPYLSYLKVRASWGQIGNQDVGTNAFRPVMSSSSSGWITGTIPDRTFSMPGALSAGFTWETITTTNIGIDARFFRDKLGFTLEMYKRVNSDMITSGEALPASFGATAPRVNFGELTTKGWELAVDFNHKFDNGLSLTANFTLSDATIKYTKWRSTSRITSGTYEGKTYGEIWGFVTDRYFTVDDFDVDPSGKYILKPGIPNQTRYEDSWFKYGPGDVKYKNLDGNEEISRGEDSPENPGDQKIIGNSTPRYEYGGRVSLAYKGFDFEVFIQGVGSRQLWSSGPIFLPGFRDQEAWYTHQMDYWTEENTNAFYPRPSRLAQNNNTQNFMIQTKYLLDMSYMRLKNVTLGYTIPKDITNKIYISKFRVYVSGENLFEITKLGDIPLDPETGLSGSDGGFIGRSYPYRRTLSFGVQLSL